jgi:hypothetical protein
VGVGRDRTLATFSQGSAEPKLQCFAVSNGYQPIHDVHLQFLQLPEHGGERLLAP